MSGADWASAVMNAAAIGAQPSTDASTTLLVLRAVQVAWARHSADFTGPTGEAASTTASQLAQRFFNDSDPRVAEAALGLACEMGRPEAVPAAMKRLTEASDRADALRWATMLRTVPIGWTEELRTAYWRWLESTNDSAGGFSLRGFIDQVRSDAEKHVHRPEAAPAGQESKSDGSNPPGVAQTGRTQAALSTPAPRTTSAQNHSWTVAELSVAEPSDTAPNRAHGAQLFHEAMCIQCHRVGGQGGANGPDLTGVGSRFARGDLLRAILEPNAAVSDQWRDTAVTLKDGSMVVGRIVASDKESLTISTNPLGPDRERVERAEIAHSEQITTSSMPQGMLNSRTRQEVLDLVGYLESAGSTAGRGG
jgi:putative heme-binding domain-containing protein